MISLTTTCPASRCLPAFRVRHEPTLRRKKMVSRIFPLVIDPRLAEFKNLQPPSKL
jgi:hypothetical protein